MTRHEVYRALMDVVYARKKPLSVVTSSLEGRRLHVNCSLPEPLVRKLTPTRRLNGRFVRGLSCGLGAAP